MKFMCLAYEEQAVLDALSPEAWRDLREETLAYVEILRKSGHLVDTHPLQSATKAATLRVRDGRLSVLEGPYAETREQLGGFFLIEAEDREEAIRLASRWPSARLGSIGSGPSRTASARTGATDTALRPGHPRTGPPRRPRLRSLSL